MRNIMLALFAMLFVMTSTATFAQTATPAYRDVLKTCGEKWRASDERKTVKRGEGSAAWQAFRAMCVKESGYVPKRAPRG